jgi:hypothetical protein
MPLFLTGIWKADIKSQFHNNSSEEAININSTTYPEAAGDDSDRLSGSEAEWLSSAPVLLSA